MYMIQPWGLSYSLPDSQAVIFRKMQVQQDDAGLWPHSMVLHIPECFFRGFQHFQHIFLLPSVDSTRDAINLCPRYCHRLQGSWLDSFYSSPEFHSGCFDSPSLKIQFGLCNSVADWGLGALPGVTFAILPFPH